MAAAEREQAAQCHADLIPRLPAQARRTSWIICLKMSDVTHDGRAVKSHCSYSSESHCKWPNLTLSLLHFHCTEHHEEKTR